MLITDYLVVGAGAASMAFVDTLLTEQPNVKATIVDQHAAPGGHWNDAYGYVRLHQPSLFYGVASEPLEGDWIKDFFRKGNFFPTHRASKEEVLTYYEDIMDKWVAEGRVEYFPNCVYDFSSERQDVNDESQHVHSFSATDGTKHYDIRVNVKLVNGVLGENAVPSRRPLPFPIDSHTAVMTPNDLYDLHSSNKKLGNQKFIVLGCGKTGMDAVVFLQRDLKVPAANIAWVIPNDVWMLSRERLGSPSSWPEALLEHNLNATLAGAALEQRGIFVRLDKNVWPTTFRSPVIGWDELGYLRRIKNLIRQGRVTSVAKDGDTNQMLMNFEKGEPLVLSKEVVLVHCTCSGPLNGNKETDLFPSKRQINLKMIEAPPVPISMSCLALLESCRRKGTLDVDFGRQLVQALSPDEVIDRDVTEHEILSTLVRGYDIAYDAVAFPRRQVNTLIVKAAFFALMDKDPLVPLNWLKGNRLSLLMLPFLFKSQAYETVRSMISKKNHLGLTTGEAKMLTVLATKLKVLEGK